MPKLNNKKTDDLASVRIKVYELKRKLASLGGYSNSQAVFLENEIKRIENLIKELESLKRELASLGGYPNSRTEFLKKEIEKKINETFEWAGGKVTAIDINGKKYYQFNDIFRFSNYGDTYEGTAVMVEISGILRTFIVRHKNDAVSVPLGKFDKDPIDMLSDYGTATHYNFRSTDLPDSLIKQKNEMKKIAQYYATDKNSTEVGTAILYYLGYIASGSTKTSFTFKELNEIAGKWSGSWGMNKFNGEIEAHAELLVGDTLITNSVKTLFIEVRGRSEDSYYKALAIADLAKNDTNSDKIIMDLYWGLK